MNNFALINSLHPELLAIIFSLVAQETRSVPAILTNGVFETYSMDFGINKKIALSKVVALSGVCRYWRSVALRTRSFWTYTSIELSNEHIQRSLDIVSVWHSRACAMPLDIYLTTQRRFGTPISKNTINQIVPGLSFGSKQIGTLHLSLPSMACLNTLLKTWFSNGISTTLTKLEIDVHNTTDELSTLQDWISQCQGLQVLRLHIGTLYSDYFPVMPNLVDLELFSDDDASITTTRLANIFNACPNLRRLKLHYFHIEGAANGDLIPTPVPLQHLEMVSLQLLDVTRALPPFSSKSNSLSLSISPSMDNLSRDLVDEIISFSQHSTIIALDLCAEEVESDDFCRLIPSLPHLQIISLNECHLDNLMANVLRGANESNRGKGAGSSTFPAPHTIWLENSTIGNDNIMRSLVSSRRLKQLRLKNCFLDPSRTIVEAKELCEHLLGAVSDLSIMNYDKDKRLNYFP